MVAILQAPWACFALLRVLCEALRFSNIIILPLILRVHMHLLSQALITCTLILFLCCSVPKEMLLPLSLLADHLSTGSVDDNTAAVSITVLYLMLLIVHGWSLGLTILCRATCMLDWKLINFT